MDISYNNRFIYWCCCFRQAVSYSREQVVEMMEFLIEYSPPRLYWEPAEVFHKLSCVQLLLQLISIACDWRTYYGRCGTDCNPHPPPKEFSQDCFLSQTTSDVIIFVSRRSDTVRYALDILSILTVVPKTQLLLSEAVAVVDEGGSSVSTVGRCCQ